MSLSRNWRHWRKQPRLWLLLCTGMLSGISLAVLLGQLSAVPGLTRQLEESGRLQREISDLAGEIRELRAQQHIAVPATRLDTDALLALLAQTSKAQGIALARVQQQRGAVTLQVQDVAYAELAGWLITLHQRHRLQVSRIVMERAKTAGRIHCQLRFEAADTPPDHQFRA